MTKEKWKNFYDKYLHNSLLVCLVVSFLLNLIIETLARQQIPGLGGFIYMFTNPLVFLANWLIILATLSVATLFRRRAFVMAIVVLIWMLIGVANGIILTQRMTPFTVADMTAATEGATIITNYMSVPELVAIAVVMVLVLVGFVILFIKGPKKKAHVNIKRNLLAVILIIACTFGYTIGMIKIDKLSTFFGNLAYAYTDYGVPYCFINTWLNQGISKPSDYSEEAVAKVVKDSGIATKGVVTRKTSNAAVENDLPNILFLQLESFIDPTLFNNIKISEDPIPNYRKLMAEYSGGSLTVPACGAGTANTEFEAMTGLSVKFFGPGEYPFKAVLKDLPAESVATDLADMGYGTHAIHNHRALFYNRNEVFDNIGYDTFTSVEYMSDVEKTPKNWAKDKILTEHILDAMKSTKGPDYIYTISVQGHGKYPEEKMIADPAIQVTADTEEMKNKYEYYINQVHEMDQFVKELTDTLSAMDEKVVLVMYGDHIPALDVTEDDYDAKDLYQTQYVIWSNFPMKKKTKDLTAYQLPAEVLGRLGIKKGTTTRYNQNVDHDSPEYLEGLKLLGYDMLYGRNYVYGGGSPYKKTGMKMGGKEIKIEKIVSVGGKFYIKGKNFTEQSKVTLGNHVLKTIYLGPELLGLLEEVDPNDASKMKVSQIDRNNDTIISTTE